MDVSILLLSDLGKTQLSYMENRVVSVLLRLVQDQ